MYKVLRKRSNGDLVSCVTEKSDILRDWVIIYLPDKWIKPKVGRVLVCKKLEDAEHIAQMEEAHEIWKCHARGVVPLKRVSALHTLLFAAFWDAVRRCLPVEGFGATFLAPEGTYGADKIKLIERVWPV